MEVARNPNAELNSVRRVAVVPFSPEPAQARISGEWQTALLALGYRVIDRGAIDPLLKEHGLALSGLVDPAQAPRIGGVLGVEGLVTGTPGAAPYVSYDAMGQPRMSEPPPLSVKLVDARTARVFWNLSTQAQDAQSVKLLRLGSAVNGRLLSRLADALRGGGWNSFPAPGWQYRGGDLQISVNPSLPQSSRLRIGVYPLAAAMPEQGLQWADKISQALLAAGYDVIDRLRLDEVIKEQRLSNAGLIKPEDMIALGKIAGIDGLVFGAVYGEPACAYSLRLTDIQTGEIYWSGFGESCEVKGLSSAVFSFLNKKPL